MPRVTHVKKARKDNPVCKKGESYYWWQFAFSSKSFSLTRPRASQLTRSPYYSTLFTIQEQIEDTTVDNADELQSVVDDALSALAELRDETEEKLQNMSEHGLECTPTGELIQERVDALENALQELECIDTDFDDEDEDEEQSDNILNCLNEITEAIENAHV